MDLTADYVRGLLSYCPDDGSLRWNARHADSFEAGKYGRLRNCRVWNTRYAGTVAGTLSDDGYIYVKIDGVRYLAHRLIWLITYGVWPAEEIDHRDGDKSKNKISNLRDATPVENGQNMKLKSSNASGYHGVSWNSKRRKWVAQIRHGERKLFLGYRDSPEQASELYLAAKRELHPFQPEPR